MVCSKPAWLMFDGRKIQWFCSTEQKTETEVSIKAGAIMTYPLTPVEE